MKNNNQKIIRKLSVRSLKNNHMRNLFAILAIALTAMLFTALASMGMGMVQIAQEQTMREVGGKFHAGLKDVTKEQMDKVTADKRVKQYDWNIFIGIADNIYKHQAEIRYTGMPDSFLPMHYIELAEGTYPQKENEVIVDTFVLDELKKPHELGVTVPLSFSFQGETVTGEFVVSGWYEGDSISHASTICVSESYWEKLKGDRTDEDFAAWTKEHPEDKGVGLYACDLMFADASNIEENVRSIILDAGYEPETDIDYGVNWAYMSNRLEQTDPLTVAVLVFVAAVILLTGYMIIYNIFQISVYQDIRYYGLLKTVGTTKKQIKSLIRRQAFALSIAGIPLGLAAGFLAGKILLPISQRMTTYEMKVELRFDPLIFVFGTVFSLLTVLISCSKPGRIAGCVSPVEAVRYTEGSLRVKKQKKSESGAKIHRMALSNLGRNKKKTVLVILSLSLSVTLLCIVLTAVSSFRIESYLSSRLISDVQIGTTYVTGGGGGGVRTTELDMAFADAMDQQEGILSRNEMWYSFALDYLMLDEEAMEKYESLDKAGIVERGGEWRNRAAQNVYDEKRLNTCAYAYDTELLSKLNIVKGNFDAEKFQQGGYILMSGIVADHADDAYLYEPGDQVTIARRGPDTEFETVEDENGYIIEEKVTNLEEVTYEVMALIDDLPPSMTDGSSPINGCFLVLPKKDVAENEYSACIMVAYDVDDAHLADFEAAAADYTENVDPTMGYMSRDTLKKEFSTMISTIYLIGIALSAVIALIGVLNFINSIITGILTRKREFAILGSIGMTQRQLKKMLVEEGLWYVLIAGGVSIVLGSALSYLVMQALGNVVLFFSYRYNAAAFLIMLPLFALLAVAVPYAAYSRAAKESIVERLRSTES